MITPEKIVLLQFSHLTILEHLKFFIVPFVQIWLISDFIYVTCYTAKEGPCLLTDFTPVDDVSSNACEESFHPRGRALIFQLPFILPWN